MIGGKVKRGSRTSESMSAGRAIERSGFVGSVISRSALEGNVKDERRIVSVTAGRAI